MFSPRQESFTELRRRSAGGERGLTALSGIASCGFSEIALGKSIRQDCAGGFVPIRLWVKKGYILYLRALLVKGTMNKTFFFGGSFGPMAIAIYYTKSPSQDGF